MNLIHGLDHVGIRVTDFEQAVAFYQQFGFEVARADLHERVVVLVHSSGVVLNLLDSAIRLYHPRNVLMDESIKYAGYTHLAFRVPDIRQAMRQLKLLGIELSQGPTRFGDGKTSIFFRDPDRNVIELTQVAPARARQAEWADKSEKEAAQ